MSEEPAGRRDEAGAAGTAGARAPTLLPLAFADREEERAFRAFYVEGHLGFTRILIFAGAFLVYLYYLWDDAVDPIGAAAVRPWRFFVVTPFVVACGLALYHRRVIPWAEWLQATAAVLAFSAIAVMQSALARGLENGIGGILLVVMFQFIALRMRFPFLAVTALLDTAVYFVLVLIADDIRPTIAFLNLLFEASAAGLGLFSTALLEVSQRRTFANERRLEESRRERDAILYSLIPDRIAGRLRTGERVVAEACSEVTVLFADLAGFTALTRRLGSTHVVEVLGDIFAAFDRIAADRGVEKIKTIGDAYMAAAGIPDGGAEAAAAAAEAALDFRDFVAGYAAERGFELGLRVGLHTGPAIAGVIGATKPVYDCWGDTVNIASRLQEAAAPGEIQCSETTYWRLRDGFELADKGKAEIRDVGEVHCYALTGRRG